jgi:hypothetical protein
VEVSARNVQDRSDFVLLHEAAQRSDESAGLSQIGARS